MKKILILFLVIFYSDSFYGQNLLGLDGGLEGSATVDNSTLASAGAAGVWQKSNANQTIALETSIKRSGSNSLKILNQSTTGRRVFTPIFNNVVDGSRLVLQYYRRVPTGSGQENIHSVFFPSESQSSPYSSPSSADTWEKVTYVPTAQTSTGDKYAAIMHRLKSSGDNTLYLYIDDLAVYVGTSVDNIAPDSPLTPNAKKGSNDGEIDISWSAPSSGTDNGGYLVIRKANEQPTGSPNVNGIYSVGSSIGDGIVAYVGTDTSFTDSGLNINEIYYYKIFTFDKAYNYSSSTTAVSSQPLPVELTSFKSLVEKDKVKLTWSTATEVNNLGFDIERKCENNDWKKIGFVQGHGNSNSPKNYTYTDQPIGGINFKYRLKQIDFDGTYEYSPEVEAKLDEVKQFVLEQNYPNPFNPTTTIRFSLPVSADVIINVFNLLGEKVAELVNTNLNAGYHEIPFDGSKLTSGIYFYQLRAGEFKATKKFIIAK